MASSFVEERLKILKNEVDSIKVRVGKLEASLIELKKKFDSLDETVTDLCKWR